MIFQVDKNILLTALQRVSHAVITSKKANSLRHVAIIFHRFIFYANCNKLTIKASNLDVFMSDCVDIDNQEAKKKAFAVEARSFMRVVKTLEQLDQFTRSKEVEGVQCVRGKDKIVINPIIDWSETDVWYFLNNIAKVNHCELYDKGWRRIGCLFCPMASQKEIARQGGDYPKYKALIIRTIHRLRENGYMNLYKDLTDAEVFKWWVSKKGIKKWYYENKKQKSLFSSEEINGL